MCQKKCPQKFLAVFFVIALLFLSRKNVNGGVLVFESPEVEVLQWSGESETTLDLVILGEGYTEAELPVYATDVIDLVQHLFSVSPFFENQFLFNVFKINVVSADSGIDVPSQEIYVDTPFDAEYQQNVILIKHWENLIEAVSKIPATDVVMVLANTPLWGGAGNPRTVISCNCSSPGTNDRIYKHMMVHELGHALGLLADEYDGTIWGTPGNIYDGQEPSNVNSTIEIDPVLIKWWEHLGYEGVDIFEGALSFDFGVYRPTQSSCLMRILTDSKGNYLPFCRVCREDGLIPRISALASFHTSWNPVPTEIITSGKTQITISWKPVHDISSYDIDISVYTNGSWIYVERYTTEFPFLLFSPPEKSVYYSVFIRGVWNITNPYGEVLNSPWSSSALFYVK